MEVVREMIHDRGYSIADSPIENIFLCENTKSSQDRLMIFTCRTEKFNIESVKYFIYLMQQHDLRHGIVIYNHIITSSAKKAFDHLLDYTIEIFERKELQYNATHHRLFCPHVRLSKDVIEKELSPAAIQHLPVLLRNDMIARYYHFLRGDVIRIHRKNGSIVYRLVK